ncbi:thiamine-binding protein [Sutcliffiella halmapala]|uniref:thiamine-binding protein n=1 Tax=Sutcliffiella halmapala TaxID=79882 RepID=UPI0009954C67|nr:thiamine-binding protein [Sutcliffiella halmapala]
MAKYTVGIQIMPNGRDVDTDGVIPSIVSVLKDSGLPCHVGPMETVVEGPLDEVFSLIKTAQQVGIDAGATEVVTNVKIHYKQSGVSLEEKLTHV